MDDFKRALFIACFCILYFLLYSFYFGNDNYKKLFAQKIILVDAGRNHVSQIVFA